MLRFQHACASPIRPRLFSPLRLLAAGAASRLPTSHGVLVSRQHQGVSLSRRGQNGTWRNVGQSSRAFTSSTDTKGTMQQQEEEVTRLRRSVLYMPASNERALAKIASIPADAFIMDMEDAVAPDQKPLAREQAVLAAAHYRSDVQYARKELVIRVNAAGTEWHAEDVKAVAQSQADAVLLPKVESAKDVLTLLEALDEAASSACSGTFNSDMRLWCMIETPMGVLKAAEIAGASPRVECLVMGTVDLANDLRCLPSAPGRWNLQFALNQVVCTARAHRKSVVDGVYINLADDAGFALECRQGRELGFDGKTLIHPKTVVGANDAFSPTDSEVEHSRRVVQAHIDAVAAGAGCATLDGKLVEALHVKDALRVIALADHIRE